MQPGAGSVRALFCYKIVVLFVWEVRPAGPLAEIFLGGTKISTSGAEPAQLTAMAHLISHFWFRCDENATIGDKMIYASSKDTIKKTFTGLSLEFQANDQGDLDYTTLRKEVETRNA